MHAAHGINASAWYNAQLLFPRFDKDGNVSVYFYPTFRYGKKEEYPKTTEFSIDRRGHLTTSTCMFTFLDQHRKYPLWLLAQTDHIHTFVKSAHVQKNDAIKIFMKTGTELSEQDMVKINDAVKRYETDC